MQDKKITRIISIIFSMLFFVFATLITIYMSLFLFGFYENDKSVFLQWAGAIFSIYKFSSFLLPLSLLYASIVLLIPGWGNNAKAMLLAFPFVFFTSVGGEYAIYTFVPSFRNASIASFIKWTIVLISLFIVFAIFMLSHMMAERFFRTTKKEIIYQLDLDIVAQEYKDERGEENVVRIEEAEQEKPKETFFSLFKTSDGTERESRELSITEEKIERKIIDDVYQEDHECVATKNDLSHNDFMQENIQFEDVEPIEVPSPKKEEVIHEKEIIHKEDISPIKEDIGGVGDEVSEKEDIEDTDASVVQCRDINSTSFVIESTVAVEDATKEKIDEKIEDIKEIAEETINEDIEKMNSLEENLEIMSLQKEDYIKNDCIEEDVKTPYITEYEDNVHSKESINKVSNFSQPITNPSSDGISLLQRNKNYHIPFELLAEYPDNDYWIIDSSTRKAAFALKSTLNEFKINVEITGIKKGPVVTMFEVLPPPGIKLAKISALQDNIALRLAAKSVRIVAPIPGKRAVGIEIPNEKRAIVGFRELIEVDNADAKNMAIPIVLGKDITGEPKTIDLAQTPHLLIAGATGAGKSVCVNSIILSILYNNRPDEVKLLLVDPKIVELKLYNDIAHLLSPVITEPKKAFQALQYCICEMERRYAFLDRMSVRDIKSYNKKIKAEHIVMERLPYIVIIIDEFADLMATTGKELEGTVSRLCAMSRAVGIHLVLATQRPSTDVITGLIKANIPSRIAFMVASRIDSRIILDDGGADKLLGKGDMLYVSPSRPWPTRIQGAFVSEEEVERVVAEVKKFGEPDYIDDEIFIDDDDERPDSFFAGESDPLYDDALDIVLNEGKASASYIQRRLKIGYNRAARIIEEMEEKGVVGPANGSKPRDILGHF